MYEKESYDGLVDRVRTGSMNMNDTGWKWIDHMKGRINWGICYWFVLN